MGVPWVLWGEEVVTMGIWGGEKYSREGMDCLRRGSVIAAAVQLGREEGRLIKEDEGTNPWEWNWHEWSPYRTN